MDATQEQPPSPEALRRGYELPTLNVKGLLLFLFVFLLMAVAIHAGAWVLEEHLLGRPRAADAVMSGVPVVRHFVEPDVQPTESHNQMPWEDLADLRRAEAARFEQLGWAADPRTGSAVIPDSIVTRLAERYKARAAAGNAGNASPVTAPATGPATMPATAPAEATPPPAGNPAPTTVTTPSPGGQP